MGVILFATVLATWIRSQFWWQDSYGHYNGCIGGAAVSGARLSDHRSFARNHANYHCQSTQSVVSTCFHCLEEVNIVYGDEKEWNIQKYRFDRCNNEGFPIKWFLDFWYTFFIYSLRFSYFHIKLHVLGVIFFVRVLATWIRCQFCWYLAVLPVKSV